MLQKFHDFQRKAEMYYVYHSIQRYTVRLFYTLFWRHILAVLFYVTYEWTQASLFFCFSQDEPFTSHLPEALFNMARFLLHAMINEVPVGISKVTRIKTVPLLF